MRAWRVHELGEPKDVLRFDTMPRPEPGPGEVRITVEAVALNFPDVLLCRGEYQERPPIPFTPGLEVAGTVADRGEGSAHPVGARVLAGAGLPAGGLAEEVVVPDAQAFPIPVDLPAPVAASLLVTYQTGWFGLHRRAGLRPGETLLVHAGASGVGSAAIQLGKAAGARVIATAGGPAKVDACRRLGAHDVIDYTADDFVEAVKELTEGRGADVIYDPVGGEVFDRSRRCVAFEGRILVIGFASGRIPDTSAGHVLIKNYSVVGLHWGLYRRFEPDLIEHVHRELLDLYAKAAIAPLVGAVEPLENAPACLQRIADRNVIGKIVLQPEG